MPPSARITRDMILDAALEIARRSGAGSINARTVARALGCSTQPVMYQFETIRELKRAAYAKLDLLHTQYLMDVSSAADPLTGIGLNYIRFAVEEPNWFRFLFQSGFAEGKDLAQLIDAEALLPILSAMQAGLGMSMERSKDVFLIVAMFVHGYASILANNALEYDEAIAARQLERAFTGAAMAVSREETDESHSA